MNRLISVVALSAMVAACAAETPKRAVFEFEVIDGAAFCTTGSPIEARCMPSRGATPSEYVRTPGQLASSGPASDALNWMDFGAQRDSGARARVVMDRQGGKLLESQFKSLAFNSQRMSGIIELPVDDECPCQAGRFELTFQAAGPDGILDTGDDQHRRLSRGRIRTDGRPFCSQRMVLPVVSGELTVNKVACPVARTNGGGSGGTVTSGSSNNTTAATNALFADLFDHESCVFFGWDDEESYTWNGGLEDWNSSEAADNGWYDNSWDDAPGTGDDWANNWDESADWNDSTDGGWGDDGSSDDTYRLGRRQRRQWRWQQRRHRLG